MWRCGVSHEKGALANLPVHNLPVKFSVDVTRTIYG